MSKPTIKSLWLLPFLAFLLCADTAHACQCVEAGPCEAFWKADVVFIATATSKSRVTTKDDDRLSVRVAAEQVSRGDTGGREVEVITVTNQKPPLIKMTMTSPGFQHSHYERRPRN